MMKKKEEILDEEPLEEALDEEALDDDEALGADAGGGAVSAEADPDVVSKEAIKMTADVPVQVVAVLGKKAISVKDLIDMKLGSVVDLGRPPNEMVDLVAGGKLIAKGELVEIDGKLGVRVVKIVR